MFEPNKTVKHNSKIFTTSEVTVYMYDSSFLTSAMYVLVTPTFPFSIPHRNLAAIAQAKFWLKPKKSSQITVENTPNSSTGLLPSLSDNHPHNKLPAKDPKK